MRFVICKSIKVKYFYCHAHLCTLAEGIYKAFMCGVLNSVLYIEHIHMYIQYIFDISLTKR